MRTLRSTTRAATPFMLSLKPLMHPNSCPVECQIPGWKANKMLCMFLFSLPLTSIPEMGFSQMPKVDGSLAVYIIIEILFKTDGLGAPMRTKKHFCGPRKWPNMFQNPCRTAVCTWLSLTSTRLHEPMDILLRHCWHATLFLDGSIWSPRKIRATGGSW